MSSISKLSYHDDGFPTATSDKQIEVEASVLKAWSESEGLTLLRSLHEAYTLDGLNGLESNFTALDASQPWLCYWMAHAFELLDVKHSVEQEELLIKTISMYQNNYGGFGGGIGQLSHLATTYSAIMTLAIIGSEEAYKVINRDALYDFLLSLKQEDGSFLMHMGGEKDTRGCYCALAVASICNILTKELTYKCADFLAKCQTYEGGFSGIPGSEAHGGFTYCAVAALHLINSLDRIDSVMLLDFCTQRQMQLEGGFQGRTNKLVDGCYSFWNGAVFPIVLNHLKIDQYLFDRAALQEYILGCCQDREIGGLLDKPDKYPDAYHTCYVLSGLSILQYYYKLQGKVVKEVVNLELIQEDTRILPTHPIYNITPEHAHLMIKYFEQQNQ